MDGIAATLELCPYCPARAVLNERYEIIRQLGAGNFSQVFLVRDLFHVSTVRVIKLLKAEFTLLADSEAYWLERMARVDSHHRVGVPKYYGQVQFGDQRGLVLEQLQSPPPFPSFQRISDSLQTLQRMIVDVALLLHTLHAPPFSAIHADVKVENLMWNEAESRFCLIDFGNCTPLDKVEEYRQSYEIQSLLYRAPEVLVGLDISSKIDVWSLGVVVLQVLQSKGQPPFVATTRESLLHQIAELTGPFPDHYAKGVFCSSTVPLMCSFEQSSGFWRRWRKSNISRLLGLRDVQLADLIAGMLDCDPESRLSPAQVLQHPFLAHLVPFPPLYVRCDKPSI